MAELTVADKDALARMPAGWFSSRALNYMVRRADWRCDRLTGLGVLERRLDPQAETPKWIYRKKDAAFTAAAGVLGRVEALGAEVDRKLSKYDEPQTFAPELEAAADAALERLRTAGVKGRAPTKQEDQWLRDAVKASSTLVAAGKLVNPACGVHGPIPCEGATCTCGVAVDRHQAHCDHTPMLTGKGGGVEGK